MCRFLIRIGIAPALILAGLIAAPVFAQETRDESVGVWRALDEDFRQAVIEEISARRGLDPNHQNPDWLIRSAADIEEALRVSCEISGETTCADVLREGEELAPPPEYTPEQGRLAGEAIRRAKFGADGQ